jgi:Ankyrin repeats (3 copies)
MLKKVKKECIAIKQVIITKRTPYFFLILMASAVVLSSIASQAEEFYEPALWLAIADDDEREFERLLAAGHDPLLKGKCDFTLLMAAAWQGHEGIVKKLLKAGVEIDAQNAYGDTALMIACCLRHEPVVATLVAAGAHVELLNNDCRNASDCASGFTFERNESLDFGPKRCMRGYMDDAVKRTRAPAITDKQKKEQRDTLHKIQRIKMLLLKKMAVQEEPEKAMQEEEKGWFFSGIVAVLLMGWFLKMEWGF